MCKHIMRYSCGGLKASYNDRPCSTPMSDGRRCQRFEMTRAEGACGECYVCNTEMAEAKRKAEMEAAAENPTSEGNGMAEEKVSAGASQNGKVEEEVIGDAVAKEVKNVRLRPFTAADGGN